MKILIFEYITGGGFCNEDLPASLAREGGLMLAALLADFSQLAKHEIVLMQDARCVADFAAHSHQVIVLTEKEDVFSVFDKAVLLCDAVWIIAPETNNILFNLTKQVEVSNKLLLSSPSSAIAKTTDKYLTSLLLALHFIPTIDTSQLVDFLDDLNRAIKNGNERIFEEMESFPRVIKPIDGAGCENSFFIQNYAELKEITKKITHAEKYIIQPFMQGESLSICALFKQGQAHLLCINRQHLQIKNQQFNLLACEVNIPVPNEDRFKKLLNNIAQAFPELLGYVGIDIILSDQYSGEPFVVEINPRLTSSYSGINQALGINVADLVLQSLNGTAIINPLRNQTVFIDIAQEKLNAAV